MDGSLCNRRRRVEQIACPIFITSYNGRGGYHTNLGCTITNEVVHQAFTYASKREKNVDGYLDGYILLGAYYGTFLGEILKPLEIRKTIKDECVACLTSLSHPKACMEEIFRPWPDNNGRSAIRNASFNVPCRDGLRKVSLSGMVVAACPCAWPYEHSLGVLDGQATNNHSGIGRTMNGWIN